MDENENKENINENGYGAQQPQGSYAWSTPYEEMPKKQKGLGGKIVALALVCAIIGGILGAGGAMYFAGKQTAPADEVSETAVYEGDRAKTELNTVKVNTGALMTAAEVYAANVNSTVGITTSITTTNFWGYTTNSAASGSGFIITEDGYIITNYHVIEDSNSVTVTMYDGTSYDAKIVGYDGNNDIAVLKVEAEGLTPVVLGDSNNMNVGDTVVAIGNPLGELTFSLTLGTVSALDREITLSSNITMKLIQTDCAINSGNSGGALFNLYGEVIGITNAKYSSSGSSASIDNIGFAIPVNTIRNIVKSIIEKGYITKPYIGVSVTNVSTEAQGYGLPAGAAVQTITEGSPAEEGGLQQYDIVTAVDGEPVTSRSDLVTIISGKNPGDVIELTVYRQSEELTVTITVGEQKQDALPEKEPEQQTTTEDQSPYDFFSSPFGGIFGFGG